MAAAAVHSPSPHLHLLALPDEMLAHIMSYLPLSSRGNAARTCHRLRAVFHHPSVWSHVSVFLERTILGYGLFDNVHTARLILTRFATFVKSLSLEVFTDCYIWDDSDLDLWRDCMDMLVNVCAPNLRRLHLNFFLYFRSNECAEEDARVARMEEILRRIASLIRTSPRLHSVSVRYWPRMKKEEKGEGSQCPVQALLDSGATLRSLNLSEVSRMFGHMSGEHPFREHRNILSLVEKFQDLHSLSLTHVMVRQEVLEALSHSGRSTPLRWLNIRIVDEEENGEEDLAYEGSLDTICVDTWTKVVTKNPDLLVNVTAEEKIEHKSLMRLLKPTLPLAKLTFWKNSFTTSGPEWKLLSDVLVGSFRRTLQALHIEQLRVDRESEVISLLERCPRLRSFSIAWGVLSPEAVLKIAQVRGQDWYSLMLPLDLLDVDPRSNKTESAQKAAAIQVEEAVSKTLGYTWKMFCSAFL